jgi:hypothetical protein
VVHISIIEARLIHLGIKVSRWFQAEVRELQHVLFDHEKIIAAVPGRYFGGFALLVATDHRVLLIDKRALFMTIEDIRYDMISEVEFNSQLSGAAVQIFTLNKLHKFTSMKYKTQLRYLCNFVQKRIMEMRSYQGSVSPQMSIMAHNPAERFPSPPAPEPQIVAQPEPIMVMPSRDQHKIIGAAALTAMHRPHFVSGAGAISTRTSLPVGNSTR